MKYVQAPRLWLPLLWVRTSVARRLSAFLLRGELASPLNAEVPAAAEPQWDKFDDPQKKAYYAALGQWVTARAPARWWRGPQHL